MGGRSAKLRQHSGEPFPPLYSFAQGPGVGLVNRTMAQFDMLNWMSTIRRNRLCKSEKAPVRAQAHAHISRCLRTLRFGVNCGLRTARAHD
jgi:hypothetical protein